MLRAVRQMHMLLRRRIHTMPTLTNEHHIVRGGLYSVDGLHTAWTDQQTHLLERLTALTVETENETRTPFAIVLNTALKSDEAHVFNCASQAYNNHLFFEALTDASSNSSRPGPALQRRIDEDFGGLDQLKEKIVAVTESLPTNGWVFVIEEPDKTLAVLRAHNSGTPFSVARTMEYDLNGPRPADVDEVLQRIDTAARTGVKNHSVALLALNLWESAYLTDYGFDRAAYVDKWWQSVDWDVVTQRYFPAV